MNYMNKLLNKYIAFSTNIDNIIFIAILYLLFRYVYVADYAQVAFISVLFVVQLIFSRKEE